MFVRQSQSKAAWIARQMKAREAEFTETHNIRVFCGTWNVNCKAPKEDLRMWLDEPLAPDIYAIGFQEIDMSGKALLLNDLQRSQPWEHAIQEALGSGYHMMISKQLVGIFIALFVKKEHLQHIHDLRFDIVGCGLLGVMGNKGGIAVHFLLHDTSFCFVNCHLAASLDHVSRRNQDYKDLCRRLTLALPQETQQQQQANVMYLNTQFGVFDHDHLFWMGDLNYRISLPDLEIKQRIEMQEYSYLLKHDQLLIQKELGKAFVELQEAPITFQPTYKFDPGTDRYDTSEKKRSPAWCDRVQWRGQGIKCLRYSSCPKFLTSDHKPVSGLFTAKFLKVVPEKRLAAQMAVMHLLDKMENDSIPDAQVNSNVLIFSDVRFDDERTQSVFLQNIGQVVVNYCFIPKHGSTEVAPPWLSFKNQMGLLMPGENLQMDFTVHVTPATAPLLNKQLALDAILVLHIEGGKDIFISIQGNYLPSCFGTSLDQLAVRTTPCRQAYLVPQAPVDPLRVPIELWRLIDYVYRQGLETPHLFLMRGDSGEIELIREFLDNGLEFSASLNFRCDIHSVAECLIRFLGALPEPVVPFTLSRACLDAADNPVRCGRVVSQLPRVHRNVFMYIIAFLRDVLAHSHSNHLTPRELAMVFSREMLRSADTGTLDRALDATAERRAQFLLHFLQQ
eukprot:TRINITY_DN317_c0_g1_i1.p1 TRINITY_DN317_c0_g1~~TRINITY_DN317_c0_g1_i1.p1  ORF type:complete len:675 (-),score=112.24 TRINITY_DN317_c0_g1_i1:505-2529(-)